MLWEGSGGCRQGVGFQDLSPAVFMRLQSALFHLLGLMLCIPYHGDWQVAVAAV